MQNKTGRRGFIKQNAALAASSFMGAFLMHGKSALAVPKELGFFETIEKRRSIRKYKNLPVPKKDIVKILEAARLAPTAGNQQPWKFLVIQDKKKINKIKEECIAVSVEHFKKQENPSEKKLVEKKKKVSGYYETVGSASVYIVVLTDSKSKYPDYNHWDGPLAAGYLILAARALGYGTVFYTDSIPDEVTKKVLNIPDRYQRVCIIPVGIPESWPDKPSKKEFTELVCWNKI